MPKKKFVELSINTVLSMCASVIYKTGVIWGVTSPEREMEKNNA